MNAPAQELTQTELAYFSAEQVTLLNTDPPAQAIESVSQGSRQVKFLKPKYMEMTADAIFRLNGCQYSVIVDALDPLPVVTGKIKKYEADPANPQGRKKEIEKEAVTIGFVCRTRVIVHTPKGDIVRAGVGSASESYVVGDSNDTKRVYQLVPAAANTYAFKNALKRFGRAFGIALDERVNQADQARNREDGANGSRSQPSRPQANAQNANNNRPTGSQPAGQQGQRPQTSNQAAPRPAATNPNGSPLPTAPAQAQPQAAPKPAPAPAAQAQPAPAKPLPPAAPTTTQAHPAPGSPSLPPKAPLPPAAPAANSQASPAPAAPATPAAISPTGEFAFSTTQAPTAALHANVPFFHIDGDLREKGPNQQPKFTVPMKQVLEAMNSAASQDTAELLMQNHGWLLFHIPDVSIQFVVQSFKKRFGKESVTLSYIVNLRKKNGAQQAA